MGESCRNKVEYMFCFIKINIESFYMMDYKPHIDSYFYPTLN